MHRSLMALCFLLLLTVIPRGVVHGQEREAKMLDPTRVPLEAARVEEFAPRGWKIHSQARGDLNDDHKIDVALILFDESLDDAKPRSVENPPPALVIVFATEQGGWRRAGINTRLIVSDDSSFAPLRVEIKNGVAILRQEEQSDISENTNDYAYTYRFRYEPTADRFLLIGEDDANTQRDAASDGIRVSDNYLTGARVITVMHSAHGKYVRETNTVRQIDKQKVFLEEATMQDIDFYQLMDEFRNPRSAPTRRKPR